MTESYIEPLLQRVQTGFIFILLNVIHLVFPQTESGSNNECLLNIHWRTCAVVLTITQCSGKLQYSWHWRVGVYATS